MSSVEMKNQARTVVFTGPRNVEVQDRPLRDLGPEDVLVRTLYSGISAGTEMNVFRGQAPQWRTHRDPVTRLFAATDTPDWSYPLVYGYAAVGRVEEVGTAAVSSGPPVGALVFTYSPHASWSVVRASDAVVLPALADPRIGVLSANLNTALNGVLDARPSFGDAVVVSGLGVIGLCLVKLLRRTGVSLVVGVDAIEHRRQVALQFGADVALSPEDKVAEEVRKLTDDRGADIVVEVSGASRALTRRSVPLGITVGWWSCPGTGGPSSR